MTTILSLVSLGALGLLFGLGLGYAGIKFKVEEDERIPLIKDALPGANCGGCGFAGCDAFAAAVIAGTAKPSGCPVGGDAAIEKISNILGIKAEKTEKKVAFIKCKGGDSYAVSRYNYYGLQDCKAMTQLADGGHKACKYGCLGVGSCLLACKFGAISLVDGVAKVDPEKCTACGMCLSVCPKNLIDLVPANSKVRVVCNSKDNAKVVRSVCTAGCYGCKLCVKTCKFDAITVDNQIAKIDYDKCTSCKQCVEKCPARAISNI